MKKSLVMTIYNGEQYIQEQLDSIKNQTKKLDEVIIIDDCSKDNSYDFIKKYIEKNQLNHWQLIKNQSNLGYQKNFKKGLELSNGDIVFLCDQDDRWHLDKIEIMSKYMLDEKILCLASSFNFMDEYGKLFTIKLDKNKSNNNLLAQKVNSDLTNINFEQLIRSNFSQGCTMAVRKNLIDEYLELESDLVPHDLAFNMLASLHNGCYYLDLPLIDYRIHNNNTIGLDNVISSDVKEKKNRRIDERIKSILVEKDIVLFSLKLNLNEKQRYLCEKRLRYYETRIKLMENKKTFSLMKYFILGKYKGNGTIKTFIGDIMNTLIK